MTLTDTLARGIIAVRWPDGSLIDRLSGKTAGIIAQSLVDAGWVHPNAPRVVVLSSEDARRVDDAIVRGGWRTEDQDDDELSRRIQWAIEESEA